MTRKYVNQLRPEETVNEVFQVTSRQLRPNRNGILYLQMRLADRTGSLDARMWNVDETILNRFDAGDYVRVEGTTQIFQGAIQLIVSRLQRVPAAEVDPSDFSLVNTLEIDRAMNQLAERLRGINNPHLRALIDSFLLDEEFMAKLAESPAAVSFHHAYRGGLAIHIANMLEMAASIAPLYPLLDKDLLLAGVFLHDIGKINEFAGGSELTYTDSGQLLGHITIGLELLAEAVDKVEKLLGETFPEELLLRLKHMLVSHHGEYEFGSVRLPMTLEAMALHCLDYLDSRMAACVERIQGDPPFDNTWTAFFPALNRKLYRGTNNGGV
ncbi:MAG TPA: HD domain-containing protein [Thermogutta sp.]|nr:HD domain-containing protein [Thermogutta sp.]HPZ82665.1 HD domain-containing protein [Thermogutta sp.]